RSKLGGRHQTCPCLPVYVLSDGSLAVRPAEMQVPTAESLGPGPASIAQDGMTCPLCHPDPATIPDSDSTRDAIPGFAAALWAASLPQRHPTPYAGAAIG